MEKLECIIVHRSMSLVSSLASLSLATPTISTILVTVRDGEIVRKRSILLNPFKHVVVQQ